MNKTKMSKVFARILINIGVGVVLIFIWLKFVNLGQIIATLKTTDLKYALVFFLFFIISGLLRSIRLKILLHQFKIPLKKLTYLTYLSQFLSFLIPLRLGELSKSVYLNTHFDIPLAKSVVWVFIDRFLDFWVNLLLISVLLLFVTTKLSGNFQIIALLILLTFSLIPLIIIKSNSFSKKLLIFLSRFLVFNKFKSVFLNTTSSIIDGFKILQRDTKELTFLIILTVLAIISDSFYFFFIFLSLGINLGFLKNLLGSLLNALTFLIPAAPGYVGSAEAAGLAVYSGFLGLDPNIASAGAVLAHVLTIIAILVFGLSSLYLLKFDLNLVFKKILKKN